MIIPAARCRPGCIGTRTCGVAARSQRAQQLTKRAKSARALEEKLRGYGERGPVSATKSPCTAVLPALYPCPHPEKVTMLRLILVRTYLILEQKFSSSKPSAPAAYRACEQ